MAASMNVPSNVSDIRMQVMWNRLISVVEEQAMTLLRTAFSTSVREAGDLSAGVFDPEGRMKPSPYYDRIVDVMEELVRFTVLLRPHAEQMVDRYSERKDRNAPVDTPVEQAGLA